MLKFNLLFLDKYWLNSILLLACDLIGKEQEVELSGQATILMRLLWNFNFPGSKTKFADNS